MTYLVNKVDSKDIALKINKELLHGQLNPTGTIVAQMAAIIDAALKKEYQQGYRDAGGVVTDISL